MKYFLFHTIKKIKKTQKNNNIRDRGLKSG